MSINSGDLAQHEHLLRILSDGAYYSGEILGDQLGVTRASVWKRIAQLQELGVDVCAVKGKGYCLHEPVGVIDAAFLLSQLLPEHKAILEMLKCEMFVSSTNACLLDCDIVDGRWSALFAEAQVSGRGRRGRVWQSGFASNLAFSIAWHYETGAAGLEGLSLAVGVVIARCLADLGVHGVQLKWPNDIYLGGKKLGGVLIELGGDLSGQCKVVVGVGLNLKVPPQMAGELGGVDYVDLHSQGYSLSRNALAAKCLNALVTLLSDYKQQGFSSYKHTWEQLNAHVGCDVDLVGLDRPITGKVIGVTEAGAIKLEIDNAIHEFVGGEISLRAHK